MNVVNETRNKTYERLANIAGSVGVDEEKFLGLLAIPETSSPDRLNIGNQVTDDIKWMTKVKEAGPRCRQRTCLTLDRQTELLESMSPQPSSSM